MYVQRVQSAITVKTQLQLIHTGIHYTAHAANNGTGSLFNSTELKEVVLYQAMLDFYRQFQTSGVNQIVVTH